MLVLDASNTYREVTTLLLSPNNIRLSCTGKPGFYPTHGTIDREKLEGLNECSEDELVLKKG